MRRRVIAGRRAPARAQTAARAGTAPCARARPTRRSRSSSQRWVRTTSASPSTAASTANAAVSSVDGPREAGGAAGRATARSASRTRVSSASRPSATPRRDARPGETRARRSTPPASPRAAASCWSAWYAVPGARATSSRGVELLDGIAPGAPLPLDLRGGPQREVEALDRVPAAQRLELGASGPRGRPRRARSSGDARWTTFRYGRHGLAGSLIGAVGRAGSVMRSWNGRPSSRDRDEVADEATARRRSAAAPPRAPRRASRRAATRTRRRRSLTTQSAPCSVAARRAIRVTHSR